MKYFATNSPLSFFNSFDREFDRLLNSGVEEEKSWKPFSRIQEKQQYFHLTLDIPGVDKEHLKVELKDHILNISGERIDSFKDEQKKVESSWKFNQSFSLPKEVNLDEIEISQHNGILDVILPKHSKEHESKSLEVKTGKSQLLA